MDEGRFDADNGFISNPAMDKFTNLVIKNIPTDIFICADLFTRVS